MVSEGERACTPERERVTDRQTERERAKEHERVWGGRAREKARERESERERVCVCVCVCERERDVCELLAGEVRCALDLGSGATKFV